MGNKQRAAAFVLGMVACMTTLAATETRKEFRYTVGPRASVAIMNQYGPVSVKPTAGNQVIVTAILRSNKVEVDNSQNGNRIELRSYLLPGANPDSGHVAYEALVPSDASVTVHSNDGPLRAERLGGDVEMEGDSAAIEVRDVSNAHVHIKTLNGTVTLTNVRGGHVEVRSVSGEVTLNNVSGPLVTVSSTSGKIHYNGDFGSAGEYSLTSHTGDIEATIPADASVDVTARSVRGQVENDFPLQPKTHTAFAIEQGRSFVGTVGKAASSVVLRTFSGKIRLKKH